MSEKDKKLSLKALMEETNKVDTTGKFKDAKTLKEELKNKPKKKATPKLGTDEEYQIDAGETSAEDLERKIEVLNQVHNGAGFSISQIITRDGGTGFEGYAFVQGCNLQEVMFGILASLWDKDESPLNHAAKIKGALEAAMGDWVFNAMMKKHGGNMGGILSEIGNHLSELKEGKNVSIKKIGSLKELEDSFEELKESMGQLFEDEEDSEKD